MKPVIVDRRVFCIKYGLTVIFCTYFRNEILKSYFVLQLLMKIRPMYTPTDYKIASQHNSNKNGYDLLPREYYDFTFYFQKNIISYHFILSMENDSHNKGINWDLILRSLSC